METILNIIKQFKNKDSEGKGIIGDNKTDKRVVYIYFRKTPKYMPSYKYGVKIWHPNNDIFKGTGSSSTTYKSKKEAINSLDTTYEIAKRNEEKVIVFFEDNRIY